MLNETQLSPPAMLWWHINSSPVLCSVHVFESYARKLRFNALLITRRPLSALVGNDLSYGTIIDFSDDIEVAKTIAVYGSGCCYSAAQRHAHTGEQAGNKFLRGDQNQATQLSVDHSVCDHFLRARLQPAPCSPENHNQWPINWPG